MSMRVSELPAGWSDAAIETLLAPLEDGRILHQGWSPQCEKDPSPSDDKWGVLKTTAIQPGAFCPEHNKLLPDDLSPRPQLEVKDGDLLITCAGPRARCGVACLVRSTRQRLMISGKMYRFRASTDHIEPRYLEAFLQTQEAQASIDKMKTGTSESGLNLTHDRFRRLIVRLAPLDDQHRIVGEIEKQLTRLGAGVAALKRMQANLKRYRAAVLKAACEGRLVPTEAELARREGRPYEPASVLLERIKSENAKTAAPPRHRKQGRDDSAALPADLPALPGGWAWATIGRLSVVGTGSTPLRSRLEYYSDGTIPWVTSSLLNQPLVSCATEHVTEAALHAAHLRIYPPGTLLVAMYGEGRTRGKCSELAIEATINQAIAAISLRGDGADSRPFLKVFLWHFYEELRLMSSGGVQPNLNLGLVARLPVPLPPLAEQHRIAAEVERRLSIADELDRIVSANLLRSSRLRQSVLRAAFAGELAHAQIPHAQMPQSRAVGQENADNC